MTRSIPFHKQTDPNKQAGQVVFSPSVPNTSEQYLHQSHKQETTLAQYIAKKDDTPKRITFDEWIVDHEDASAESIWYAALKYGKVS